MVAMNNPTDAEILQTIYSRYVRAFTGQSEKPDTRSLRKVYYPIDIEALAKQLNVNKHVLFGRLYYHLDQKHRYRDEANDAWTHLFAKAVGDEINCIHFPYLAALVAQNDSDSRRYAVSLAISIIALLVSLFTLGWKIVFG